MMDTADIPVITSEPTLRDSLQATRSRAGAGCKRSFACLQLTGRVFSLDIPPYRTGGYCLGACIDGLRRVLIREALPGIEARIRYDHSDKPRRVERMATVFNTVGNTTTAAWEKNASTLGEKAVRQPKQGKCA
jgi:hypothetical protein